VSLTCNVTRLRYAATLQVCVQLVTPYRVTHLQLYEVALRGNVTSVYPLLEERPEGEQGDYCLLGFDAM